MTPIQSLVQLRRRETLFEGTRGIIKRLIRLSIEAGCLTGRGILTVCDSYLELNFDMYQGQWQLFF